MKIVICTTPIRPEATDYPPLGSLAVIQSLLGAGYDPVFFDIDGLRPSFSEVIERFRSEAPDVIGISAVVSTAYGYVKKLCAALREVLPEVRIALGGNLAASGELLHRFCDVDVCVVGEGEKVIINLANYWQRNPREDNYSELEQIKGITFLNPLGEMVFTGYETAIPAAELFDPDFSILEKHSKIENFIVDPFTSPGFFQDARSYEPHRTGKKAAIVVSTKGCVARCTFCHRWDKGFRQIPPAKVIARIQGLMDRYNVGFIQFGDENFGSDRKATDELIRLIKPLDILWQVAGVRTRTIDLDLLKRMNEAGCVALYYGFETGSPDILKVMEKNLHISDNFHAAQYTYEAGLHTTYQLVLGMPGENQRTIAETTDMIKKITEFLPEPPFNRLSINYIQALPGTAVYEYARAKGLIGPTLEDEDRYLLSISDINASDDTKFLNFTQCPYLTVRTWRKRMIIEATTHWYLSSRNRPEKASLMSTTDGQKFQRYDKGGYFNLHDFLAFSPPLLSALYPVRLPAVWLWVLITEFRLSPARFFSGLWELLTWPFRKHQPFGEYRSLREVMLELAPQPTTPSNESMKPLRLGR